LCRICSSFVTPTSYFLHVNCASLQLCVPYWMLQSIVLSLEGLLWCWWRLLDRTSF
jgi:hypothetical protein